MEKAEKEYEEEQFKIEAQKKEISNEKKILADNIEKADEALDKAYNEYNIAKDKVNELMKESDDKINLIVEEYNEKMSSILDPAKKAIKDAQENKYKALSEFNDKFGVYNVRYTGDRAYKEFQRVSSWINDIFNRMF